MCYRGSLCSTPRTLNSLRSYVLALSLPDLWCSRAADLQQDLASIELGRRFLYHLWNLLHRQSISYNHFPDWAISCSENGWWPTWNRLNVQLTAWDSHCSRELGKEQRLPEWHFWELTFTASLWLLKKNLLHSRSSLEHTDWVVSECLWSTGDH